MTKQIFLAPFFKLILAICLLLGGGISGAHAADYKLEPIVKGLDLPWGIAFLPDGSFLVTELAGTLHHIYPHASANQISAPIKGVPEVYYSGQGGLMDIVLHPDYESNNLVYLSLAVGTDDANTLQIIRGRYTGKALEDVKVIFEAAPKRNTPAHYGGRMAFMADNSLLITVGEGFNYREEAQNPYTHLGSIVRVGDDGAVPKDNPYYDSEMALPEIWSYGHRNAQGILYDSVTRTIFQSEHGAKGGDELNIIEAGNNYGWPAITLGQDYNSAQISPYTYYEGMEQPIHHWTPSIAPSGMALYRGDAFPAWRGDIFVTSLTFNKVVRVDMAGKKGQKVKGESDIFTEIGERLRDIRVGRDGLLYILSEGHERHPGGKIWRVSPQ